LAVLQRAQNVPQTLRPADVLQLQRTIGNRATGRLLQAKLKLGPAGDQYEQEADRVAKQVVRASRQPAVQREEGDEQSWQSSRYADSISDYQRSATPVAEGISRVQRVFTARPHMAPVQRDDMEDDELQAKPLADGINRVQRDDMEEDELQAKPLVEGTSQVQRDDMEEDELQAKPLVEGTSQVQRDDMEEDELQAKPLADGTSQVQRDDMEEDELQASPNHGLEGGDVETDVARSIESAKGSGQPLHDEVRSSMERGFGADFSGVNVHTGPKADALNRSLNARAFTTGKDIFFGKGQYNPGSTGGQELIAHELTHTVQQGAAGVQQDELQRAFEPATITAKAHLRATAGAFFNKGRALKTDDKIAVDENVQQVKSGTTWTKAIDVKPNEWNPVAPAAGHTTGYIRNTKDQIPIKTSREKEDNAILKPIKSR
jgi:hypothetical protein